MDEFVKVDVEKTIKKLRERCVPYSGRTSLCSLINGGEKILEQAELFEGKKLILNRKIDAEISNSMSWEEVWIITNHDKISDEDKQILRKYDYLGMVKNKNIKLPIQEFIDLHMKLKEIYFKYNHKGEVKYVEN